MPLGPPVGGFLVTYADWRWIFYINVPIGLIGMLLVTLYVADTREERPARLDFKGLVLSGVSLACLMFGFESAGRGLVGTGVVAGLIVVGTVTAALYVRHARRVAAPLLDLRLLEITTFRVSVTAGSLFRVGVGAIPFLLPLMLQLGFGFSALQSGLVTFASAVGAVAMKPATQRALRWVGFRGVLGWNGAAAACLLAVMGLFRPSWPMAAIYVVLVVGGFLRSLQFTAYNTVAYADIPRERMSAATSFYSTLQQLSLTLGITVGAAVLEVATRFSGNPVPSLPAFSMAFGVVAACALLATPLALRLPATAGEEMSGHRIRGS